MKRSAEQVTSMVRDEISKVRSQTSHLNAEINGLKRQIEMENVSKSREQDNQKRTKKQFIHSTNEYHELATQIKENAKAMQEVPIIAKNYADQQLQKFLRQADWQPKMAMAEYSRKLELVKTMLEKEDTVKKDLFEATQELQGLQEFIKAVAQAAELMRINVADASAMQPQLSHPEAIKHVAKLMKRAETDLNTQLAQIDEKYSMVRLPSIVLAQTPPEEAEEVNQAVERAKKKFIQMDKDKSGTLEAKELNSLADWVWSRFNPGGREMSEQQRQREGAKLLDRLDKNKDGKMSFKEFEVWFRRTSRQIESFRREQAAKKKQHDEDWQRVLDMFELSGEEHDQLTNRVQQKVNRAMKSEEDRHDQELKTLQEKREAFKEQTKSRAASTADSLPKGKIKDVLADAVSPHESNPEKYRGRAPRPPQSKTPIKVGRDETYQLAMYGANLGLSDLIAQGEAELAGWAEQQRQEKLMEPMKRQLAQVPGHKKTKEEKEGDILGNAYEVLHGKDWFQHRHATFREMAQDKLDRAFERFKFTEGEAEVNRARQAIMKGKELLKAAKLAEEVLGVEPASRLLTPTQRTDVLQILLDHAACISQQQQATSAIMILGHLPGGLVSADEARKVVHVLLQRIAEQNTSTIQGAASNTLKQVVQNQAALPVLLNCLKNPSHATKRGTRPTQGGAANKVSSTAAETIEAYLNELDEKETCEWIGDLVETFIRHLLEGLAHTDSSTKTSCSRIAVILRKRMPEQLTRLAEKFAPGTGAQQIQHAISTIVTPRTYGG